MDDTIQRIFPLPTFVIRLSSRKLLDVILVEPYITYKCVRQSIRYDFFAHSPMMLAFRKIQSNLSTRMHCVVSMACVDGATMAIAVEGLDIINIRFVNNMASRRCLHLRVLKNTQV